MNEQGDHITGGDGRVAVDDEVLRKRQERLRMWQEKQMKKKSESEVVHIGLTNVQRHKRTRIWDEDITEDEEQIQAKKRLLKMKQINFDLNNQDDENTARANVTTEVDPLDAYMQGIETIAPQRLELETQPQNHIENGTKVGVITLDEILSSDKNGDAKSQPQGEYHSAFMEEFHRLREKEEKEEQNAKSQEVKELEEQYNAIKESGKELSKGDTNESGLGLIIQDDGDFDEVLKEVGTGPSALELLQEKIRKKDLKLVDHSKIEYPTFRKSFYMESARIASLSEEQVKAIHDELEIQVRGAKVPNPIELWSESGLSDRTLAILQKHEWAKPFAIQRQALPAIMSGRDLIGVAKTGSGKTLAFLLPMIRHVLDQPRVQADQGPIGLIMAPARELAVQIYAESKKFTKALNIRSACCYGGAGIKEQIGALKTGAEILVATPGRLIDLLSANKVISLQRVTMVVLDEADRMFDMGFEPQIMKIINNTRPDRQIAMFSATFPPQVERVAKDLLKHRPLIIVVGGRTKASANILQHVEIRQTSEKFPRLLQILGEWYTKGNILVFVKSQDRCDKLFQDLMKVGYRSLTLHGGKDQFDRDSTIQDFKEKNETLMVATSVAGRGLDVPDLCLVINFDVPNHLEDYIHRIGRTGRAGKDGTAYTFILPSEEQYAPDLVKALNDAKQVVPEDLQKMSDMFRDKIARGEAKFRNSGYRGHGFTFQEDEKTEKGKQQELLRKQQEVQLGLRDDVDDEEDDQKPDTTTSTESTLVAPVSSSSSANAEDNKDTVSREEMIQRARRLAMTMADPRNKVSSTGAPIAAFSRQVEINEYPQQARWKVTNKESIQRIQDDTACSITGKGVYIPPGRAPNPGERPLYLQVEGNSDYAVTRAVNEIQRILDNAVLEVGNKASHGKSSSKYSVL